MKRKKIRILAYTVALIVIIFNAFFFQLCIVSGESMYPTFKDGNLLLINKCSDNYERYDIIVVRSNHKLLIKRIIALPNETLQIDNNEIFINGEKIKDVVDCVTEPGIAGVEIKLSNEEYFVLGDNREHSTDSRDVSVGAIKTNSIIGKITKSVLPFRSIE